MEQFLLNRFSRILIIGFMGSINDSIYSMHEVFWEVILERILSKISIAELALHVHLQLLTNFYLNGNAESYHNNGKLCRKAKSSCGNRERIYGFSKIQVLHGDSLWNGIQVLMWDTFRDHIIWRVEINLPWESSSFFFSQNIKSSSKSTEEDL